MENLFYFRYISGKNDKLQAQIEANKKITGYTVHKTPEVENDQLFSEMVKPFQGKVILVDF